MNRPKGIYWNPACLKLIYGKGSTQIIKTVIRYDIQAKQNKVKNTKTNLKNIKKDKKHTEKLKK